MIDGTPAEYASSHESRLLVVLLLVGSSLGAQQPAEPLQERDFLSRVRRLTIDGRRAGEGYWARDGKRLVFQSEREPATRSTKSTSSISRQAIRTRISPGIGKTTCAFFRPGTDEILFSSTHHDPKSKTLQQDELDFRASGKERRYSWDYDPEMDIYARSAQSGSDTRLTNARGYDAEASYSPDGQLDRLLVDAGRLQPRR